jgi:hypothetical protein
MIKMTLNGAEGGAFPTTTFRQAGLLYKPLSTEQGSKITVASTNGFKAGETVTGDTTGATGVIRLVDDNERTLWIDTVVGAFIQSETISSDGVSAAIERVVNNTNLVLVSTVASADDVVTRTGEFMYISNREVIARNDTQTEEVRFIIGF